MRTFAYEKGLDKLYDGMIKVARDAPRATRKHLDAATKTAERMVETYPPERGGSYVRTDEYKRGVERTMHPTELQALLETYAAESHRSGRTYNEYVGGDAQGNWQWSGHKGRFHTVYGSMLDAADYLRGKMDKDFTKLMEDAGFTVSGSW